MTDFTDLYYVHYNPMDSIGNIPLLPDGVYSHSFVSYDDAKRYFDALLPSKLKGIQLLITTIVVTCDGDFVDNPLLIAD